MCVCVCVCRKEMALLRAELDEERLKRLTLQVTNIAIPIVTNISIAVVTNIYVQ